jgi:hypothetical protein
VVVIAVSKQFGIEYQVKGLIVLINTGISNKIRSNKGLMASR